MTATTPIALMVEEMLATGAAHEVIVRAVETVELHARERRRPTASTAISTSARGTRLSEDWQPSGSDKAYALGRGMTGARIEIEAQRFRNYWISKAGKDAAKRDWGRTWQNWILTAMERGHVASNKHNRNDSTSRFAPAGADAILAGMGRIAHRIVQRRGAAGSGDREGSQDADAPLLLDPKRGGTR
jgi:hypothetical protein